MAVEMIFEIGAQLSDHERIVELEEIVKWLIICVCGLAFVVASISWRTKK